MTTIPIHLTYLTGINKNIFRNVRLTGSWDDNGRYSDRWSTLPLEQTTGEDGCPCFKATVDLDGSQVGQQFHWGILFDGPAGDDLWGVPTEINDHRSDKRYRSFILKAPNPEQLQEERYYLTHCRHLGAQKYYPPGQSHSGIQFSVWAPNATNVEVVFGGSSGYIADDGSGIESHLGPFPMFCREEGVWQTDTSNPSLADFSKLDHRPYMFRVTKDNGKVVYRTDLYSRCQIGRGQFNPQGKPYTGSPEQLDGSKSCSVVVDPERVSQEFCQDYLVPESQCISAEEFWRDEFTPGRPVPKRVEDLVIYELHVGALGYGKARPGNFEDAIGLLDYLVDLGVNAVELLPIAEFRDQANWGYETSHYFALENSAGGPHQLKHFVKECHRRGIAVILDVVYNHYSPDADRAQWAYDSDAHERNIYYWYEGNPSTYRYPNGGSFPEGGYIDNMSTGYAPRFHEEAIRKLFISSAAALLTDFHIDGFRVDQTTSMHLYNVLHADGRLMGHVNSFGAKFLREWTRTLKLIQPAVLLMAEDHSDWDQVTESANNGGLGFDSAWYANFYHHLVGDTERGPNYAELIRIAGYGQDQPLAMDHFAGVLGWSGHKKVVYHESHDEAANSHNSRRTILAAVNSAPLIGETRRFAEARCRFACGMTLLSAGTPMFFMGEEIGAQKPFRYTDFFENREDLLGERQGHGQRLFKFYQDIIRLRHHHAGLRSHEIDILHVHNANRVIVFKRWDDMEALLVVASLNNQPFAEGYIIESSRLGAGSWEEIFSSDAEFYGGNGVGNAGTINPLSQGRIQVVMPANGFVVLQKVNN